MEWNLNDAIAYYKKQGAPGDQNALVGLLREIQAEYGGKIPNLCWLPWQKTAARRRIFFWR